MRMNCNTLHLVSSHNSSGAEPDAIMPRLCGRSVKTRGQQLGMAEALQPGICHSGLDDKRFCHCAKQMSHECRIW